MRIGITLSLILFSLSLCAHTYVDSVYAEPVLDGYLFVSPQGEPEFLANDGNDLFVGDIDTPNIYSWNSSSRAYLSFLLPTPQQAYELVEASLRMYQFGSIGNAHGIWIESVVERFVTYPQWDCPGGDSVHCTVSHVNYGMQLGFDDWETGDEGNPNTYNHNIGEITSEGMSEPDPYSGEIGHRSIDVTQCVLDDYTMSNIFSQYRIAFDVTTDNDSLVDAVFFGSSDYGDQEWRPTMYLTYWDGVSVEEEEMASISDVQLFPQPALDFTNVQFHLSQPENLSIDVYDIRGRKCRETSFQSMLPGQHSIPIGFRNLPSGVYLLRMQAGSYSTTHKVLHLQ